MELIDIGKAPVSEEAPQGKDVRYEPDFEALSQEVAKMGTISGSSEIDWDKVVALSSQILEKESKHLQVTSYLCYGLIKTSGLEGLATGVHILKDLLENFWETMFPPKKRMKGRRGIIAWWEEKTSDFIDTIKPVVWEKEKRDQFVDDLDAIDKFLGDNMEDAPLLTPFIKKIKSVVTEEREEPDPGENQDQEQNISNKVSDDNAPGKQPGFQPGLDSDMKPDALLEHGLGIIGKAASSMISENPFNPLPYRLNRLAAWIPIDDLPTASGGKTMISPPDEQIINAMATLYDNAEWEDLADSCESNIRQFLFWLDLSRYVSECMEQLGHEDICHVIEAETLLFVQRLKGIEQMCFSDGTPFADSATREWLDKIARNNSESESAPGTGGMDSLQQRVAEQMAQAQKLVKKKKFDQALTMLKDSVAASQSERERFLWKISVCKLLLRMKKTEIASSYIDDILDYIEKFKLDRWEPDNALEAFSLALTGLRLQKDSRHESLIEKIIKKISMLDPVTAIRII